MKIIGVTGPSGAGKSVFCDFLRRKGCAVFDCDAVYHGLIAAPSACTRELSDPQNFGPGILNPDGSVNRRVLASLVFEEGSEDRLLLLNRITHRHVTEALLASLDALRALDPVPPAAVIDAPLLFQAGMERLCDVTVALLAPRANRLSRLGERDGLDTASLEARLNAAPDDSYYTERADRVLVNDKTVRSLRVRAGRLLRSVLELPDPAPAATAARP